MPSPTEPPSRVLVLTTTIAWLLLVVYMFGLPVWSYLFNDLLGYGARLCTLHADEVICGNGANYTEVARRLGRRRPDGVFWGCSCGEGVFGDWACPINRRFSVSFYVSATPGTGALALFASFPALFLWVHGRTIAQPVGLPSSSSPAEEHSRVGVVTISQGLSQVFYGLFLFATECVFPTLHITVVFGFVVFQIANFIIIAQAARTHRNIVLGVLCTGIVLTLVLCLLGVFSDVNADDWITQHAFYLGEATGFSFMAGMPVALVWASAFLRDVGVECTKTVSKLTSAERNLESVSPSGPAAAISCFAGDGPPEVALGLGAACEVAQSGLSCIPPIARSKFSDAGEDLAMASTDPEQGQSIVSRDAPVADCSPQPLNLPLGAELPEAHITFWP